MKKSQSITLVLMTLLLASCTQQSEEGWDTNSKSDSTSIYNTYHGYNGWFYYPLILHNFYRGPYIYSENEYYSHGYGNTIGRGGFGGSHSTARA